MFANAVLGFRRVHRLISWSSGLVVACQCCVSLAAAPLTVQSELDESLAVAQRAHAQTNIKIDGSLSEQEWASATVHSDFAIVSPDSLERPPYETRMLLLYTERGLYVGVDMEQPHADLVKRLTGRDARGISRDEFSVNLDTSGTGRYGYWMTLALGDNVRDGTLLPERRYSSDWDGAWYGGTAITVRGWSAEFFIPWSQMAMPRATDLRTIGIFGSRRYASRDERWAAPPLPSTRATFLSDFKKLELVDVNPTQQWSVFPFASVTQDRVESRTLYAAGADFFWRPSSNFQATASVKPDFGGIESDDVIVNLTAFEVFFPEKRLFFLEGQEIFTVSPRASGNQDDPIRLVNTRRIGNGARPPRVDGMLPDIPDREQNQPIELLGAVKATGQIQQVRYGVLTAFEDDIKFDVGDINLSQSGSRYGALRFLYEDTSRSGYRGVGVISTITDHPERQAMVHGIDGHWLSANGRWQWDGLVLVSDIEDIISPADNGTGHGGFFDVVFTRQQGEKYRFGVSSFDDLFELNDLGFLRRNDATNVQFSADWEGAGGGLLRDYEFSPYAEYERNGDGLVTRFFMGVDGEITLPNLWEVSAGAAYLPARYEDRNSFGNGTYRIESRSEAYAAVETDNAKPLSLSLEASYAQEDLGGDSLAFTLGLSWRPALPMNVQVEVGQRQRHGWLLHQEDRNFTTFDADELQATLSGEYFLSAKQQFRVALQWVAIRATEDNFYLVPEEPGSLLPGAKPPGPSDDFSVSDINVQLRYRWQIAPLSDVFLVYTRAGVDETNDAGFSDLLRNSWREPEGDQLVLKFRYRLGS